MPQCHSVSVCQCSMQCPQCSLFPVFSACPSATVLSVSQYFLCPGVPTPMSQCSQWSKRYSIQWSQCLSVTMFLVSQCPTVFPVLQCSQRYSVTVFPVFQISHCYSVPSVPVFPVSRCASVPCSVSIFQCSQCPIVPGVPVFPALQCSQCYSVQCYNVPRVTVSRSVTVFTVFPVC